MTVAVVLAMGQGFAMRSTPRVLCRVGGVTLLERSVRVLKSVGVERVVLVVGYRGADVTAAARGLPVEVVTEPDWRRGSGLAVLTGVRAAGEERCLVVMGDHVFEPGDVRRVLETPGRNVFAVDRDATRQVGGLAGRRPTRVRVDHGGRVEAIGSALPRYDAISAGLSVVHVDDLLSVAADEDTTWVELRQRMVDAGCDVRASDVDGFWAAVHSAEAVRALERAMWSRYGPKPTDSTINRLITRRISGPVTRTLLRTGITPDVATVAAFLVTLAGAALVALGDRWLLVAGGILVLLGFVLDGVDGELARVSGRSSPRGAVLDTLLDRYADLAVVLGLVLATGPTVAAWAWGFAAAAGCLLVSYVHAVGRDTDVRLLFRREFRLLIFAAAAIGGVPLWGVAAVAVAANVDVVRGVALLLRAMATRA